MAMANSSIALPGGERPSIVARPSSSTAAILEAIEGISSG